MTPLRICSPKWVTRRRLERETFGPELTKVAAGLGQPFMPWQRMVADIGCEIDPDTGGPAYREVVVTVPRQSGKTTLFLSWQIHRCLSPRWRHPQRSVFTAQTGKDARDKWLDEIYPLIESSKLHKLTRQMNRGMGNESISWRTGSLIRLLSTSATAGHSKTLHQAVLDEIWHDVDDRREQGIRPAMVTIGDAQILVCSTAGTDRSLVLNRKVRAGRKAVEADSGRGVAYVEFSAPDNWNPDDLESYFGFMPALCPDPPCRCGVDDGGWRHTVTLAVVESERQGLDAAEFARAYGNIPTSSSDLLFAVDVMARVFSPTAADGDKVERFALEVAEDRSSAAIVAATAGGACELVAHGPGVRWAVERANALTGKHGVSVAIDAKGPAGVLEDLLDDCDALDSNTVVQSCEDMFDAIVEATVRFRAIAEPGDPFYDAMTGATKKPVGDRFVWSRKTSANDVTPLMAASLAWRKPSTLTPFASRGG